MDQHRLKRNLRISAIAFIVAIGAMTRILAKDEVRTVTVLTIFAAGATAGALLVNFIIYNRTKKN